MKLFIFEMTVYHESYNGYDHCDGTQLVQIEAKNLASANKKFEKWFKKENWGRWYRNLSIREIQNV